MNSVFLAVCVAFMLVATSTSASQCPVQGTFEQPAPSWFKWPQNSTLTLSYGSDGITYTVQTSDDSCLYQSMGQYTVESSVDDTQHDYLVGWKDWSVQHQSGSCKMDVVAPLATLKYITFTPDCNTMFSEPFWGGVYTRTSGVEAATDCSLPGSYIQATDPNFLPMTYTYDANGEVVIRNVLEVADAEHCWCEQTGQYVLSDPTRAGFQNNLTISGLHKTSNDTSGCTEEENYCPSFSVTYQYWIRFTDVCTNMVMMTPRPVGLDDDPPYTRKTSVEPASPASIVTCDSGDNEEGNEILPVWVWVVIGVEGVISVVFFVGLIVLSAMLFLRKKSPSEDIDYV